MSSNAVVVCTWGEGRDGVPPGVEEVLTVTRKLTAAWKADLNWLVLGPMPQRAAEIAAQYGVTSIDRIDDAKLTGFQPDVFVEALAQYCGQHAPKVLLFSQTFDARVVAPRLAGRLGAGVVMNGVDLESDGSGHLRVTASAYGGDTRVVYELTGAQSVVGVSTNTIVADALEKSGTQPAVRDVRVDLGTVEERSASHRAGAHRGSASGGRAGHRRRRARTWVQKENFKLDGGSRGNPRRHGRRFAADRGRRLDRFVAAGRADGQDHPAGAVHCRRHLGGEPAHGRLLRGQDDRGHQPRSRCAGLPLRALRHRRAIASRSSPS